MVIIGAVMRASRCGYKWCSDRELAGVVISGAVKRASRCHCYKWCSDRELAGVVISGAVIES